MKIGFSKHYYSPYSEQSFPFMQQLHKGEFVYLLDSYSEEQILTIQGKENGQFELTIFDPEGHATTITLGESE